MNNADHFLNNRYIRKGEDIAVVRILCYDKRKMRYGVIMKEIKAEDIILYEDEDLLVCHKPAGFPVQSRRMGTMDLESLLRNYLAGKGEQAYVAVIHRLDQPVQGILVFAKNKESAAKLNQQIQQGKMEKRYLAYVQGKPGKKGSTSGK